MVRCIHCNETGIVLELPAIEQWSFTIDPDKEGIVPLTLENTCEAEEWSFASLIYCHSCGDLATVMEHLEHIKKESE